MPKNMPTPARRSSGSPVGSQRHSADSDSNGGHLGPRQIVNGDASMDQQLAQKWCNDCHAVGAEDAEAYGSVPSFVLIAAMCSSIGGRNWSRLAQAVSRHKYPVGTTVTVSRWPGYSHRSTVPGLGRGKQELAAGTLTPLILVRIRVPPPVITYLMLHILLSF